MQTHPLAKHEQHSARGDLAGADRVTSVPAPCNKLVMVMGEVMAGFGCMEALPGEVTVRREYQQLE